MATTGSTSLQFVFFLRFLVYEQEGYGKLFQECITASKIFYCVCDEMYWSHTNSLFFVLVDLAILCEKRVKEDVTRGKDAALHHFPG